jgi:hypothetical protein
MNYSFETLVSVSFNHTYFSNQVFEGVSIEPSKSSQSQFLNNGFLFKPYRGGFHILFDKNQAGGNRTREDVLKLDVFAEFTIRLSDKDFYNYTEPLDADISTNIFYFHNTFKNEGLKKSLHTGQYVDSKDLQPLSGFGEQYFVKPFAKLDLKLSEGLETTYSVKFKAKETYWRYILVSDDLTSLKQPAILDSVTSEFFTGPEKLSVKGKDTLAFISKNPISFNQDVNNIFQLVDNYDPDSGRYQVVKRALPSANPNFISVIQSDINQQTLNYSEIFIH